jgi:glutaredoxin
LTYLIIGLPNCSKCKQLMDLLEKKGLIYNYKQFPELSNDEQDKYTKIAKENNVEHFPIVLDQFDNYIAIRNIIKGDINIECNNRCDTNN